MYLRYFCGTLRHARIFNKGHKLKFKSPYYKMWKMGKMGKNVKHEYNRQNVINSMKAQSVTMCDYTLLSHSAKCLEKLHLKTSVKWRQPHY